MFFLFLMLRWCLNYNMQLYAHWNKQERLDIPIIDKSLSNFFYIYTKQQHYIIQFYSKSIYTYINLILSNLYVYMWLNLFQSSHWLKIYNYPKNVTYIIIIIIRLLIQQQQQQNNIFFFFHYNILYFFCVYQASFT
jgi:hypothetical protein